ncbi:MAG: hypothetical protein WA432_01530 [Candidatus Babeliaceae bacterium]
MHIEHIITMSCLAFAYIFSIMSSCTFQAWCTHKAGDFTAQQRGYLSFNPLMYFDYLMIFSLCIWFLDIGRGLLIVRSVPFVSDNIQGKWRKIKIFVLSTADIFANIVLALISLFLLVCILKPFFKNDVTHLPIILVNFTKSLMIPHFTPLQEFVQIMPTHSSMMIIFSFVLFCLVFFNIVIAAMRCFFRLLRMAMKKIVPFNEGDFGFELRFFLIIQMIANIIFITAGNPLEYFIKKIVVIGVFPIISLFK